MKIRHVDHVGIVVKDMDGAKAFFVDLGFKVAGETTVQGEWVGHVIGLTDVKSDIVMLEAPDGQLNIELSKFHQPEAIDLDGGLPGAANTLGIRHISFQVEGLEEIVSDLKRKGTELVGDIQTYENSWKLCYVRGPEGIFIELAEKLQQT